MSLTRAKYLAYLKERWMRTDDLMQAIIAKSPLLGMLNKKRVGGRYYHVPVLQTGAVGRAATYATAKTNAVGSQTRGFDVTYVSNYQILKLDGNTVDDAEGNENALFDAIDHEVKAGIASMTKDLRLGIFGNLGGARGTVASTSTVTLTLKNKEDSINFEVGDEVTASATDGTSGALRDSGQAITLVGVDRSAGTLTADENWSEISGITADDSLFIEGDFGLKMSGLLGWIPASAPGATAFFGVDRTSDVVRLGGNRYTGTGMPLEAAMVNGAAEAQLYDADLSVFVCNPIKWAQVATSIGADAQNRRTKIEGSTPNGATVSYDAIMIATTQGMIPLVGDPGAHKQYIVGLDLDTIDLTYVGDDLVHLIDTDDLTVRRGTADDWLVELKNRGNLACNAPGKNIRITVES